uniref:CRAL-TRIO domain-containing protein n=2 Tax=Hemiselmis andersenii TaxID=464988 RepID=A0A7S1E7J6_HEMAN|mmetsp:Transcript_3771/g.9124  ORF Transcript_3771/g.9124 Transcript_3771/m.9124 type:complete len:305 (+) Transcript_3771:196-1110(+)
MEDRKDGDEVPVSLERLAGFAQTFGGEGVRELNFYHVKEEEEEQVMLEELKRLFCEKLENGEGQSHRGEHPGCDQNEAQGVQIPDDAFLITCLRVWQYSVHDAARVAANFARFRTRQGWPYRLSASSLQRELLSEVHWLLPGEDRAGRGVIVYNAHKIREAVSAGATVCGLQQMGALLLEVALGRPGVPERGVVAVVDARGVGLDILGRFSVTDMGRGVAMWKDSFPCKIKKIHVIGLPWPLQATCSLILGLLSAKLRGRVSVETGTTRLAEEVGSGNLPKELGGELELDWKGWVMSSEELQRT